MIPKSEFIITNTWTHARHGHAHDELVSIKSFLASGSIGVQILSLDPEFGDLKMRSIGLALQSVRLDHSRVFKDYVDSCFGKDLSRGIRKALAKRDSPNVKVVITSSRFKHLLKLDNPRYFNGKLHVRMLDAPRNTREWESLAKSLRYLSQDAAIAMEVESSVLESQNYLNGVMHVPSHYGIQIEGNSINKARDRVGVFWPVGRGFSNNEIVKLLEELKSLNPIVKLPSGVETQLYMKQFPELEFVHHGLSDLEFRLVLSKVKVAVLGHRDYINQSSGYAGYFMANNVPMLVSRKNSFFGEFSKWGRIYAREDYVNNTRELIADLLNRGLVLEKFSYAKFVESAWKSFLWNNRSL